LVSIQYSCYNLIISNWTLELQQTKKIQTVLSQKITLVTSSDWL
jgi:hypothetical protein